MKRVNNVNKEQLEKLLKEGKTTREMGEILGYGSTTISKKIRDNKLDYLYAKPKRLPYHIDKIDSKEKAYMLGFIIADAGIKNNIVQISVALKDKELAIYFAELLGTNYKVDMTFIKKNRRFPRVGLSRKIIGLSTLLNGEKKVDRTVPRIRKDLEVYLLRGIFDANGCITWGHRKDRNRIWHKVSFTSSLKILTSVQNILYKIGIATIVRPKSGGEKCFVLEFANKKDINTFYEYLYQDKSYIPLKRKFSKYYALRLELGEIKGSTK